MSIVRNLDEERLDSGKMLDLTGVEVHSNIVQVQLGDSVISALQVCVMCVGALGHSHVGNQVSQTIGF
jgi:hypothetical protein